MIKFKRYLKLVIELRLYEESMRKILGNIVLGVKNEGYFFFDGRKEVKSIVIIVIIFDRGFCGSFNSFIFKELEKLVEKNKNKNIIIILFGRKVIDFIIKRNYEFLEFFLKIFFDEMNKIVGEIFEEVVEKYNNYIYDEVYVIYNKFILVLRYDLICERIILIIRLEVELNSEYIFELSIEYILLVFLLRFINL